MTDRLQAAWRYAPAEIWRPLFDRFAEEHPDLPIAVVRTLLDRPRASAPILVAPGQQAALDVLRKDVDRYLDQPEDARDALRKIRPHFFASDRALTISICEIASALTEYENPDLDIFFSKRIETFLVRHRLPYRLDQGPLRLIPLLHTVVDKLYTDLRARAARNPLVMEALAKFEDAWDRQSLEWTQPNAKEAIRTVSLLAENILVSVAPGNEREFSRALMRMRTSSKFPSNDFANIFDRAYTFANEYPNIRHPGNVDCVKRELKKEDAVLAALVFFGLSACAHGLCDPPV